MKRIIAVLVAGLLLATPASVLGHNVASVSGTVTCQGAYSITVHGDIYGGVRLIVKLDGVTIYDQPQNGSTSVQDFGPFTGTGATPGETISAQTSDGSSASGTLTLAVSSCATPTPVVTPTASHTATTTPSRSPGHTPPPTGTEQPDSGSSGLPLLVLLASFIGTVLTRKMAQYGPEEKR